jgi:hypothetical protein
MLRNAEVGAPYVFREYPRCLYRANGESRIVEDAAEQAALGAGWFGHPNEAKAAAEAAAAPPPVETLPVEAIHLETIIEALAHHAAPENSPVVVTPVVTVALDEAHATRTDLLTKVEISDNSGRLKNGNPPGDPNSAPRCGARARTRGGQPCQAPAVRGSARCRMHGGLSTGPRTKKGLRRSQRARWKHGRYSPVTVAQRAAAAERAKWERESKLRAQEIVAAMMRRHHRRRG